MSATPQTARREVVITGIGVVSPIGIGREAFWSALMAGQSGVGPIRLFDASAFPVQIAAEVRDFDAKLYVRPRKSLKVMAREIQFGFAAADLAMSDAALEPSRLEPVRTGVVFGAEMIYCDLAEVEPAYRSTMTDGKIDFNRWGEAALAELYPLWLLRNLPNMVACHIAIANDARGPCNTMGQSDTSSLAAIAEGARCIERDAADVMLVGGVGGRVNPTSMAFRGDLDLSHRNDHPAAACRPFDADRDGAVNGEGAAAFVLESRQHALQRGARIWGRIAGFAGAQEALVEGQPLLGTGLKQAISAALLRANMQPSDLGHVNAHGLGTLADDRYEAAAIRAVLGNVPVTAPKGHFGHLGAGGGALELAASLLGLPSGEVPHTLNYETPDAQCPVHVIHGEPRKQESRAVLKISCTRLGGAMAMIVDPV